MIIKDFFNEFKNDLLPLIKRFDNGYKFVNWNERLLKQFINECITFPKNRTYEVNIKCFSIVIYKVSFRGNIFRSRLIMEIDYRNKKFGGNYDWGKMYYDKDEKFAIRFIKKLVEIENMILRYKGE